MLSISRTDYLFRGKSSSLLFCLTKHVRRRQEAQAQEEIKLLFDTFKDWNVRYVSIMDEIELSWMFVLRRECSIKKQNPCTIDT